MSDLGQKIIDGIIEGGLLHAECAHDSEHGCVIVWSSGAAEQIEAIMGEQEEDGWMRGYYENR